MGNKSTKTTAISKPKLAEKVEECFPRLAILGTGESGKSTIFKQIVHKYSRQHEIAFGSTERAKYVDIVRNNMLILAESLAEYSGQYCGAETKDGKEAVSYFLNSELQKDLPIANQAPLHPDLIHMLKSLWNDPGIRRTYNERSNWSGCGAATFFLDKLDVVGSCDYIPTFDDILRTRLRTGGIIERQGIRTLYGDEYKFQCMDGGGGYREERKKFLYCLCPPSSVVLFVVAVHEFDEVLYENSATNRMTEALDLFSGVLESCSRTFKKIHSFILLLNKMDLLQKKVSRAEFKNTQLELERQTIIDDDQGLLAYLPVRPICEIVYNYARTSQKCNIAESLQRVAEKIGVEPFQGDVSDFRQLSSFVRSLFERYAA
jgi:GTPase SAR1 family protein